jgi:hypothetical protein
MRLPQFPAPPRQKNGLGPFTRGVGDDRNILRAYPEEPQPSVIPSSVGDVTLPDARRRRLDNAK